MSHIPDDPARDGNGRSDATPAANAIGIDALYAAVPERNTGDALLRTTQQHHVALSTMADTKANIIITVSSIVLTRMQA